MPGGEVWIGTSGWSYVHWRGLFYPKGLKPSDQLRYYAQRFSTVEINSSFYRPPNPLAVDQWREATPEKFVFAAKLWRMATHFKKLRDCRGVLCDFLRLMGRLADRHGPLLVQLPPTLDRDDTLLEAFLSDLHEAIEEAMPQDRGGQASGLGSNALRHPVAIEFRDESWLAPRVFDLLSARGAAVVVQDMPYCANARPNDAPFVYMRRHGAEGAYAGSYPLEALMSDAEAIRGWRAQGRDVYAYFNNDLDAAAVRDAEALTRLIHTPSC